MITVRPPGDKSISHRALLIAPLAGSDSAIRGLSGGSDVRSSLAVMRALGAPIEVTRDVHTALDVRVMGGRALHAPKETLDCGNSGTTARLVLGLLAGSGLSAVVDGDDSLRARPMRRVVYPLQAMGARLAHLGLPGRLPVQVMGRASGSLRPLRHRPRVASAQVKSALLLAGVTARVPVEVHEPARSRDHTERMLAAMGAPVRFDPAREGGGSVAFDPGGWDGDLRGLETEVPGDPSSAAFLVGAALLARTPLRLEHVGANPGRTAYLEVLCAMGATVRRTALPAPGDEPLETWTVHPPERLRPFDIGGAEIPALIDEIPLLAVLAARAAGRSEIRDAAELRVKESDRLGGLARNLAALGARVEEREDGLVIHGGDVPLRGRVSVAGDHRLAMAFGVLGSAEGAEIEIDQPGAAAVSYPGFWDDLESVRQTAGGTRRAAAADARGPRRIVAIDGPAASGKSTTARRVAERLGFTHLNSGHLYRAITWWMLERGLEPADLEPALDDLVIELTPTPGRLEVVVDGVRPGEALHGSAVADRVSAVAGLGPVRAAVLRRLREAGDRLPLVCDGRDIGTTVFPDAPLKVYLVADPPERARRRLLERGHDPTAQAVDAELERLARRDAADASRDLSPLRKAPDALEIDTTALTPAQVEDAIVARALALGLSSAPG